MKRHLLGLLIASGFIVAEASAGCLGCGQQGMMSCPVQCDYSHLWNGFSPTNWTYSPDCWSGGCGKGILGGHVVGLLDKVRCHVHSGGCGIACDAVNPDIGWGSIGHGVDGPSAGGPGLDGYGGNGLTTFHGLTGAGPRLMGNPHCCQRRDCFAGPCDSNCGADTCGRGGLGCHSFQTGWLSSLMERLRCHCSAQAYSCGGSLDPCGRLCGNSYPAGNLKLNFGAASYGCHAGGCNFGVNGGCDGQVVGGGAYGVEQHERVNGAAAPPIPAPETQEPEPATNKYSHPAAAFEAEVPANRRMEVNDSPAPVEYPSTGDIPDPPQHSAQLDFRSQPETKPTGTGSFPKWLNFVSSKR